MNKISSDKPTTRKSPRTCGVKATSAALLAAKENMRLKLKKEKENEFIKDDYAVAQSAIGMISKKTGIVYDEEMLKHYCLWDYKYPECPQRFSAVIQR